MAKCPIYGERLPACANPGRTACGVQQAQTRPAEGSGSVCCSPSASSRAPPGRGTRRRRPRLQPSPAAVSGAWRPTSTRSKGVISTTSGYTGGHTANPSYEQVSRGGTGHAEAVEIVYDPAKVSYDKLLDVFWHNIDPLAKDRQFCDHGD